MTTTKKNSVTLNPKSTHSSWRIKTTRKYSGALAGTMPEIKSGYSLFKFDVRTHSEADVRKIANKVFSEGYGLELFLLEKVDGEWIHTTIGEAKHEKKSSSRKAVVPAAASAELEKRIANLEESVAKIAVAVEELTKQISKKSNKKSK